MRTSNNFLLVGEVKIRKYTGNIQNVLLWEILKHSFTFLGSSPLEPPVVYNHYFSIILIVNLEKSREIKICQCNNNFSVEFCLSILKIFSLLRTLPRLIYNFGLTLILAFITIMHFRGNYLFGNIFNIAPCNKILLQGASYYCNFILLFHHYCTIIILIHDIKNFENHAMFYLNFTRKISLIFEFIKKDKNNSISSKF